MIESDGDVRTREFHNIAFDGIETGDIESVSAGTGMTGGGTTGNRTATGAGATYAIGGATVGYQISNDSVNALNGVNHYDNQAYGVSFAVNDDLTLSYGVHKSKQNHSNTALNAELEASSIQVSYSMGGATIKLAQTDVDHGAYDSSTATDRSGTTLVLSLAF